MARGKRHKRKKRLGDTLTTGASRTALAELHGRQARDLVDQGDIDGAIGKYEAQIDIWLEVEDAMRAGRAYNDIATMLLKHNRLGESIDCLRTWFSVAQRANDAGGQCQVLVQLGLIYQSAKELAEAEQNFRQAIRVAPQCRQPYEVRVAATAHGALGALLQNAARFQEAAEAHAAGLELARSVNDGEGQVRALMNLSVALMELRRFGDALPHCEEAVTLAASLGGRFETQQAQALYHAGTCLLELQRPHEAQISYDRALMRAEKIGDRVLTVMITVGLGNVALSDPTGAGAPHAVNYFQRARKLADRTTSKEARGIVLASLGRADLAMGLFERAGAYFREDLELEEELGNPRDMARAYCNMGVYQSLNHEHDAAFDSHMRDLEIAARAQDTRGMAVANLNLGMAVEAQGGRYAKVDALRFYGKAKKLCEELDDDKGGALANRRLAALHINYNEFKDALEALQLAVDQAKRAGDKASEADTYRELALLYNSLSQRQAKSSHNRVAREKSVKLASMCEYFHEKYQQMSDHWLQTVPPKRAGRRNAM